MHARFGTIRVSAFFFILSLIAAIPINAVADITLAENGKTSYRIVIRKDASALLKHAAQQLQDFLRQISIAEFSIATDEGPIEGNEIILGINNHSTTLQVPADIEKLGEEGFTIRTVDKHLIIAGQDRGTLYGVYTFLEDYLGCRWYSSKVSHIPQKSVIKLNTIDETQIPLLAYREVYYADAMDPDFAARLKLNGNASVIKDNKMVSERHAGWGTWCHTAFTFVPPDKYFEDHPEYYSLVDGKRQAKQLCFTNPQVLEITRERIEQLTSAPMDFAPGINTLSLRKQGPVWADMQDRYWDVSQMDWGGACQCPNCRQIDDREGSHIGSVLTFINQLAAGFPDYTISTLSYQYTRAAPKNIQPAGNVSIMLCNIECARAIPIATSPFEQDIAFRTDIENWSRICGNLFIWDYIVNFAHLFSPNPNLMVQQSNIKFFIRHNAKGIFAQGSREIGGDFCELRNYLVAKLLWNADLDPDTIINDFLSGYYGPASKPIREYIDLLHEKAKGPGKPLGIYAPPQEYADTFLSPEMIKRYDMLFDQAEQLVQDNKILLFRVQTARMPLMYAKTELKVGPVSSRKETLEKFNRLCAQNGIQRLSEWGNNPAEFYEKHLKQLQN